MKARPNIGVFRSSPLFINAGAGNFTSTLNLVVDTGSPAVGDIMLLFVENEQADAQPPTPSGWTAIAAAVGGTATRLRIFYKFAGASEPTTVTVTVSASDHLVGQVAVIRGVDQANPFDGGTVTANITTTLTAVTIAGPTTTKFNSLVVFACSSDRDASTPNEFSGWANANLSGVTEIVDQLTNIGLGGGFGAAVGTKNVPGATGNMTATAIGGTNRGQIAFALKGIGY